MRIIGLTILAALIAPVAAGAADMPLKAPPAPPPPPPYSWSGFYIGGDIGGAWANGTVSDNLTGFSVSSNHSGWLGGGDVGFNYQAGNFVFGIEGDFDWTSLSATGSGVFVPGLGTLQASANTNWVTTVAGRLGVATTGMWFNSSALFYIKGGGGWVENSASITNLTTGTSISASNTNSGWLVGGGVEWGFANNWSAKIEYDYLGLRDWTFNSVLLFPGDTFTASRNIQELKFGINYRFGGWGGPVTARY
jgi:outer membrane immunogenic protein